MKKGLLSVATVLFLASCGGNQVVSEDGHGDGETQAAGVSPTVSGTFSVDTAASIVKWEGSKLAGTHHGVVAVSGGKVAVENGVIQNGSVNINLSTIKELDVDAERAAKLEKHLKAPDFFNVTEYPTASIAVTSVKDGLIEADLTIKGKTKSIDFPATIKVTEDNVTIEAKFTINRTDYGIVHGSGNFFTDLTKEKTISDDISFDVKIEAKK